jgi:hypothetical protein
MHGQPLESPSMECACEQLKAAPAFSVMADISYDDVLRPDRAISAIQRACARSPEPPANSLYVHLIPD